MSSSSEATRSSAEQSMHEPPRLKSKYSITTFLHARRSHTWSHVGHVWSAARVESVSWTRRAWVMRRAWTAMEVGKCTRTCVSSIAVCEVASPFLTLEAIGRRGQLLRDRGP
jgi:hypothetical protein